MCSLITDFVIIGVDITRSVAMAFRVRHDEAHMCNMVCCIGLSPYVDIGEGCYQSYRYRC